MNVECGATVLTELETGFRFNDAVLRHLIIGREEAVTEQSFILKNKDDKGERRRRDEDGFGFGEEDEPRRERTPRPPRAVAPTAAAPSAPAPSADTEQAGS
jgi:small subunit ribosomal protein S6